MFLLVSPFFWCVPWGKRSWYVLRHPRHVAHMKYGVVIKKGGNRTKWSNFLGTDSWILIYNFLSLLKTSNSDQFLQIIPSLIRGPLFEGFARLDFYQPYTSSTERVATCKLWMVGWHMGVSKNNGTPKSTSLIGFSIIFTIHFGIPPPFLETPICFKMCIIVHPKKIPFCGLKSQIPATGTVYVSQLFAGSEDGSRFDYHQCSGFRLRTSWPLAGWDSPGAWDSFLKKSTSSSFLQHSW